MKPKKGAFANLTVNGSTEVAKEVGECENEWLTVIGNGIALSSAVVQHGCGS